METLVIGQIDHLGLSDNLGLPDNLGLIQLGSYHGPERVLTSSHLFRTECGCYEKLYGVRETFKF